MLLREPLPLPSAHVPFSIGDIVAAAVLAAAVPTELPDEIDRVSLRLLALKQDELSAIEAELVAADRRQAVIAAARRAMLEAQAARLVRQLAALRQRYPMA